MKQLRQKFAPIRKSLERNEEFLLMYRSKPLAILRPYSSATDAKYLNNSANSNIDIKTPPLVKLPDPKTISFSSKFNPNAKIPSFKPATQTEINPSTRPLDKFGIKRVLG
ncbi:MAG: hypothetical protein ACD_83C00256G0003 [uncultured bacterium]|nr:MAG: hypothetical protein ACD_83C00256G0003 [uncultured bacterium]OGJ37454.1 MAG: hypothetical protein A2182_00150 [Candidatus Pacebacteria bacterium RIFOXYA1_FULL_38_18]OGJ39745.1 MAG: hypothetical protein A2411_03125 [Candidatus Pacebacteria bacterium RIFOXYC1_FULL_39_21]